MPLVFQGANDLVNDLTNIAANLEDKGAVNRALREGAKPMEARMLHNASTDPKIITRALHDSIHTGRVKKRRDGGKYITIGVHYKEMGAYYANPVEFGHGGPAPAPMHPFVRPAFDTTVEDSYKIMKDALLDALSNQ